MSTTIASLRDFMRENRDELLQMAVRKTQEKQDEGSETEVPERLAIVIDEIIGALDEARRGDPTPHGKSSTAREHGRRRQQLHHSIEKISYDFGSISDAIGDLGQRMGLSFDAGEYRAFNLALDAAIAAALEGYWSEARQEQDDASNERIGFLAHELRNSLSSSQMAFEVLKRNEVGMHSRTGEVLERGLARLEGLISRALLQVKLKAGAKLEPQRLRVHTLLHQITDGAGSQRDITIHIDADDGLEVDADPWLLTSALSNLLQNAVKFTHRGGTVTLRARRHGQDAVIEVEDECGGLPPCKAEDLFEPFVQGSTDRRGVGLGLTITRDAIETHGGTLTVRDLPGKGCVFTATLRAVPPS